MGHQGLPMAETIFGEIHGVEEGESQSGLGLRRIDSGEKPNIARLFG